MFTLSSALRPVLLAPSSGLAAWLQPVPQVPSVNEIIEALGQFSRLHQPVRPEDLQGAFSKAEYNDALTAAAREADRWLRDATQSKPSMRRARSVWDALTGGELRDLLAPVAKNDRAQVAAVRKAVTCLASREGVLNKIDKTQEQVHWRKLEIDGPAREHLVRRIMDARDVARRWCDLAERERQGETGNKRLSAQVSELRERCEAALPAALQEMAEMSRGATAASYLQAAASHCLSQSLRDLAATLNLATPLLRDNVTPGSAKSESEAEATRNYSSAVITNVLGAEQMSLSTLLARRLLTLPEIALNNDGMPVETNAEALNAIADALRDACAHNRSVADAVTLRIAREDFRFENILFSLLEAVPDDATANDENTDGAATRRAEELRGKWSNERHAAKALLARELRDAEAAVQGALLDGVVEESEQGDYAARIAALGTAEPLDFMAARADLRNLQDELRAARARCVQQVQADWNDLLPRLDAAVATYGRETPVKSAVGGDETDETDETEGSAAAGLQLRRVRQVMEAALDKGDVRAAGEWLALVRDALDNNNALPTAPVEEPVIPRDFQALESELNEWLARMTPETLLSNLKMGVYKPGISPARDGRLPVWLRQAHDGVLAWQKLKRQGARAAETENVGAILHYLGFDVVDKRPALVREAREAAHFRCQMSTGGLLRGMPHFGSLVAGGVYDIVCLWERPGLESIRQRLRLFELEGKNPLVFYLGRLSHRQRQDLAQGARKEDLAIALLDETILVFLAPYQNRLTAFFRCALSFSSVNPYMPFRAGDVPEEMFFGREAMRREIERPEGASIVYGGRQLGKSALLRQVQRRFQNPRTEQYAWVEDIRNVGDPNTDQKTALVWHRLMDGFVREGLVKKGSASTPDAIARQIREAMTHPQHQGRRVIVMFDEADHFLDADRGRGFETVNALRTLMLDTQRRFKVVFSGLHNVLRFRLDPNQPLAHFGSPLEVGPLPPDEARELIRTPLAALGYVFENEAGILRILSYTNRHAGLIQIFCQELLKELHKRAGNSLPPITITQSDVEKVYLQRDVRDRIVERFTWTIALDTRYQAIAWSLVEDQTDARNGYARPYSEGEVRTEVNRWWPEGFRDVSISEFRSLLDEMVGLGVLSHANENAYRLRSPNIAPLLGTRDSIADHLLSLEGRAAAVGNDPASLHAALDGKAKRFSPLTYAQEQALTPLQPSASVGIVVASDALGAKHAPDALRRLLPASSGDETLLRVQISEIGAHHKTEMSFTEAVEAFYDQNKDSQFLAAWQSVTETDPAFLSRLSAAHKFCRGRAQSKRSLRVLFLLDPRALWGWVNLPAGEREKWEGQITVAQRWNREGVLHRLQRLEKISAEATLNRVWEATGGWLFLLDELLVRCGERDDPGPFAQEIMRDLQKEQTGQNDLRLRFRRSLGVGDGTMPHRILQIINDYGDVAPHELTPELMNENAGEKDDGGDVSGMNARQSGAVTQDQVYASVIYLQTLGLLDVEDNCLRVDRIAGLALEL